MFHLVIWRQKNAHCGIYLLPALLTFLSAQKTNACTYTAEKKAYAVAPSHSVPPKQMLITRQVKKRGRDWHMDKEMKIGRMNCLNSITLTDKQCPQLAVRVSSYVHT